MLLCGPLRYLVIPRKTPVQFRVCVVVSFVLVVKLHKYLTMGEHLANLRQLPGNYKCADCGKPGKYYHYRRTFGLERKLASLLFLPVHTVCTN